MAENTYLFVYGTLRRGTRTRMHHLLAQQADFVGEAGYQGRLYRIDFYPGAVPSDDPGDRVRGDLYRLHDEDRLLPRLDRYEACGPGFPPPTEYVRELQRVKLASGAPFRAWVYLYNLPTEHCERLSSGDYLADEARASDTAKPDLRARRLA